MRFSHDLSRLGCNPMRSYLCNFVFNCFFVVLLHLLTITRATVLSGGEAKKHFLISTQFYPGFILS
jgi:hypothetical protein